MFATNLAILLLVGLSGTVAGELKAAKLLLAWGKKGENQRNQKFAIPP
jgi:hypothetical protein